MGKFLQVHLLTPYPASNPNRDDSGRPKTMLVGGVLRQRISSQAIKRAVRLSPLFSEQLNGMALGVRSQRIGEQIHQRLGDAHPTLDPDEQLRISRTVAEVFGKIKADDDDKPLHTEQLSFVSPSEIEAATALAEQMATSKKEPPSLREHILGDSDHSVDVALFGRMLADSPEYNCEAACEVAHAFTTGRAALAEDYYTAIDDLKQPEEDAGAGFIGATVFGTGVYYLYAAVDLDLLVANLAGDRGLAAQAAAAFVSTLAQVTPSGKRKAFAHRTVAHYIRATVGHQQPMSLYQAFEQPVDPPQLSPAVEALTGAVARISRAYGPMFEDEACMSCDDDGSLTLDELTAWVRERGGGSL